MAWQHIFYSFLEYILAQKQTKVTKTRAPYNGSNLADHIWGVKRDTEGSSLKAQEICENLIFKSAEDVRQVHGFEWSPGYCLWQEFIHCSGVE